MPNNAPIDRSSARHGKAAAIALWLTIEALNERAYGAPETESATRDTLTRFLAGYRNATPEAQRGFVENLGEWLAMIHEPGSPNVHAWQNTRHIRPELSDAERDAHAAVWLEGVGP